MTSLDPSLHRHLLQGQVIPAHPLALTSDRRLDERYQRALTRYYCAAGVGGLAVGVHTTQFEIHDPKTGLLEPVLALASETITAATANSPRPFIKIAGLVGQTDQAIVEADLALAQGYHAGLLSLSAFRDQPDHVILTHCRRLAEVIPLIGFYLQSAVGGRVLSDHFWQAFVEIPNVVAIKIAPFNRYQTLAVIRAVVEAGQADQIALYTGNDDNIIADLLTPFRFGAAYPQVRVVGGLLGQWAVWTHEAVRAFNRIRAAQKTNTVDFEGWLAYGAQLTDANSALFDPAHNFHGCLSGIHEALRRQGLLGHSGCLNPAESLSPGQMAEIDRIHAAYPHLRDDAFVAENLADWLD